jgi:hypothetical protein
MFKTGLIRESSAEESWRAVGCVIVYVRVEELLYSVYTTVQWVSPKSH